MRLRLVLDVFVGVRGEWAFASLRPRPNLLSAASQSAGSIAATVAQIYLQDNPLGRPSTSGIVEATAYAHR